MQNQFPLPPEIVIEASRRERARLVDAREQAIKMTAAPYDQKIRSLDAYLEAVDRLTTIDITSNTVAAELFEVEGAPDEGASSISAKIKEAAKALITPGIYVSTQEIYDFMLRSGAEFPTTGLQPLPRITKIVSSTGLYKGNKSMGWSLRSDQQATQEDDW